MPDSKKEQSSTPPRLPTSSFLNTTQALLLQQILSPPLHPDSLGRIDGYSILRVAGTGGMGIVFEATKTQSHQKKDWMTVNKRVAIKALKPELLNEPRAIHHFLREAGHLEKLHHPQIIPILFHSQNKSNPYLVMPWMDGGSLSQVIYQDPPMTLARFFEIAITLADAIAYAHKRGIIHRDLKPANVLMDSNGKPYLCDFGLARTVFNDTLLDWSENLAPGTAVYMSPAVARGEAEDTRCDIYSFGAMLYEMLAKRTPYEGKSAAEIRQKILQSSPQKLKLLVPDLPDSLIQCIETAMSRELEFRYSHMEALKFDLLNLSKHHDQLELVSVTPKINIFSFSYFWNIAKTYSFFVSLIVLLILTLILYVSTLNYNKKTNDLNQLFQLNLTQIESFPLPKDILIDSSFLIQWDSDPEKEVLLANSNQLQVYNTDGRLIHVGKFSEEKYPYFRVRRVMDITNNGREELAITWRDEHFLYGGFANQNLEILKTFQIDSPPYDVQLGNQEYYGVFMDPQDVGDLDGDGKIEIIYRLMAGITLKPRGIACFDFESQTLNWFHATAPTISQIYSSDLNNDENKEIIFTTGAVGNGATELNGWSDSDAYIGCLNVDGKTMWKTKTGGFYHYNFLNFVPSKISTNTDILVCSTATHLFQKTQKHNESGELMLMNASGQITKQHSHGYHIYNMWTLIEDQDQYSIYTIDRRGIVTRYNSDFNPIKELKIDNFPGFDPQFFLVGQFSMPKHPVLQSPLFCLSGRLIRKGDFKNYGDPSLEPNLPIMKNISMVFFDKNLIWKKNQILTKENQISYFKTEMYDQNNGGHPEIVSIVDDFKIFQLNFP